MNPGGRTRGEEGVGLRRLFRYFAYTLSIFFALVWLYSYVMSKLNAGLSADMAGVGAFFSLVVAIRSHAKEVHPLAPKSRRAGSRLSRPPALPLRRAVRFLTTAKGFREVFEPTFADMDEEYFEALNRKEHFEARKIVIAYHWKVVTLLAMRPAVRALATVLGWMKAG